VLFNLGESRADITDDAVVRALRKIEDAIRSTDLLACPIGAVLMTALPPDKVVAPWIICDGRTVSRKDFRPLFNAIGLQYSANDVDDKLFNVPDMRSKLVYGTPTDVDTTGRVGQTVDITPGQTTTAVVGGGGAVGVITSGALNALYLTPIIRGR
jgi:hypothetical protein